ncbi:hypothetical protein BBN63_32890 [Streptomyces niveus]|uniref:Uncharacterized protein n=2 Tax=Streptomyces niveus TaxID=193462 RepID=A0A1U9R182_STRNV|nr:hypothetical protein BBN63_32890 [Streptomyces niveus]
MQQSMDRARITARVDVADDQSTLRVVLLGGSRLPFLHFSSADEATTWLENAGIRATADTDEDDNVVLHLPADTVDTVRELLTADYLRAEDAADALQHALHQAGITLATVTVETPDALFVEIADSDNLATGVNLGVLLGADDIAQGLELHRPKGMRKLASRLHLVLTGAVGRGVAVRAEPGCEHRDDRLLIDLHADQAPRLADRITPPASASNTGSGAGVLPQAASPINVITAG